MARPPKVDPKDPRFRPYRQLTMGLFIAVACLLSGAVIVSVVKSTLQMTARPKLSSGPVRTYADCVAAANTLWQELEAGRRDLPLGKAAESDQRWMGFRSQWIQQLESAQSDCALKAEERAPLRKTFSHLERLMDLYTTHATQYAGEVGPAVDHLRALLEKNRAAMPR